MRGRPSLAYQLGLAVVAVVMVSLPAIYVGLILLVGWGVWHHATSHVYLVQGGHAWWLGWPLLLGPVFVGVYDEVKVKGMSSQALAIRSLIFWLKAIVHPHPELAPRTLPDSHRSVNTDTRLTRRARKSAAGRKSGSALSRRQLARAPSWPFDVVQRCVMRFPRSKQRAKVHGKPFLTCRK